MAIAKCPADAVSHPRRIPLITPGSAAGMRGGEADAPPSTRSRSGARLSELLALPDELLVAIAQVVFSDGVPSSLSNLLQTCTALRERLAPLWERASIRRLRWAKERLTARCTISNHDRSITGAAYLMPWAVGNQLPTSGRTWWRLRITSRAQSPGIYVGICHSGGLCAWGVCTESGVLGCRTLLGGIMGGTQLDMGGIIAAIDPPAGYPCGEDLVVFRDHDGKRCDLAAVRRSPEREPLITVHLDHDAGALSFSVDGGALSPALSGFPRHAQFMPWARIRDLGDTVTLEGWWHSSGPAASGDAEAR